MGYEFGSERVIWFESRGVERTVKIGGMAHSLEVRERIEISKSVFFFVMGSRKISS